MDETLTPSASSQGKSSEEALLHTYVEICKSYHAIDDYRMKLLGLLPLTSLAGIVLLKTDLGVEAGRLASQDLIAFASVFAAVFTLALFIFEIRGISRCDDLIQRGREIEDALQVKGQFWACKEEAERARRRASLQDWVAVFFNSKVAACVTYSVVFSGWVFVALRYGYGLHVFGCALTALAGGLVLAAGASRLVSRLIPA